MTTLEQISAYGRKENGGYKRRKIMETLVD
jgi:hypothetical protein